MISGLILADDLTGALDTGVELSASGCKTIVLLDFDAGLSSIPGDAQVAVINTDSRHLPPRKAHERLLSICREAKHLQIANIYKKTDSALRGNVGAELSALLSCYGGPIVFAPAYPDMRRTLKGGIVLIDGVPVSQSIFGSDPFNPVKHSDVREILQGSDVSLPVFLHEADDALDGLPFGVHAMNASSHGDLKQIARHAKRAGIRLFAGCAGFAGQLPYLWNLPKGEPQIPKLPQKLLVFSGSVNKVTIQQLNHARSLGLFAHTILEDTLAAPGYFPYETILRALEDGPAAIVEAASSESLCAAFDLGQMDERARANAAKGLGTIASRLIKDAGQCLPMIIGGDTLLSVMQALGCRSLYPIISVSTGTVLAICDTALGQIPFLTKSGGLGPQNAIEQVLSFIQNHKGG